MGDRLRLIRTDRDGGSRGTRHAVDPTSAAITTRGHRIQGVGIGRGGGGGSDPPPPPETRLNVSVRTAAFPSPSYDAAASDLTSFEWPPDVSGKYSYGISLDAATGPITVDTDAPAEATDVLRVRHPGIFRFRPSAGFRRLMDVGPAPRA